MNRMETKQLSDNELIAEFMQVPKIKELSGFLWDTSITGKSIYGLKSEYLRYDSSWDWLMPVVEKVESLKEHPIYKKYRFQVAIKGTSCEISFARLSEGEPGHNRFEAKTKIQAVYESVVDFIKWYSNQPQNG